MLLSAVSFAKSKSNENQSPLCGTEKNTLPLNNGLKMNLIYKEKTEGGTDSEILQ
uniref:Mitochondrial ribosomal protein L33 n=1 Tax=Rhinolophus ferrumequinum TaxID=59479 RepID=A0A671ENX3_RHIFE